MIKNTILAAAVALTAGVMAIPEDADAASVRFQFGVGSPNYNDGYYYYGHPYYRPGYNRGYNRVSCGEARGILRDRNYRRIRTVECNGRTYTFQAMKNGRRHTVYVDSRRGSVSRG